MFQLKLHATDQIDKLSFLVEILNFKDKEKNLVIYEEEKIR